MVLPNKKHASPCPDLTAGDLTAGDLTAGDHGRCGGQAAFFGPALSQPLPYKTDPAS